MGGSSSSTGVNSGGLASAFLGNRGSASQAAPQTGGGIPQITQPTQYQDRPAIPQRPNGLPPASAQPMQSIASIMAGDGDVMDRLKQAQAFNQSMYMSPTQSWQYAREAGQSGGLKAMMQARQMMQGMMRPEPSSYDAAMQTMGGVRGGGR